MYHGEYYFRFTSGTIDIARDYSVIFKGQNKLSFYDLFYVSVNK